MESYQVLFKDVYQQLLPMFREHWDEIGYGDFSIEFELDTQVYLQLEEMHKYVGVILVDNMDGRKNIIGYMSVVLSNYPHSKETLVAQTDCFFIKPEYRGIQAFKLLLSTTEQILAKMGIQYFQVVYSMKKDLSKLLKRYGYCPLNVCMAKQLECK